MGRYFTLACGIVGVFLIFLGCTPEQKKAWIPPALQSSDQPSTSQQPSPAPQPRSGGGSGINVAALLQASPEERDTLKSQVVQGIKVSYESCELIGRNQIDCTFEVTSLYSDRKLAFLVYRAKNNWYAERKVYIYDNIGNQYFSDKFKCGAGGTVSCYGSGRRTGRRNPRTFLSNKPLLVTASFSNFASNADKLDRLNFSIITDWPRFVHFQYNTIPIR